MNDSTAPAAVGGNRLHWSELPPAVRSELEQLIGAGVVVAESQDGGFSPGMAARLQLDDGRRVFAKALGVERSPRGCAMHRSEIQVASALPPSTPSPQLIASYDDGDWVALIYEDIEGRQPAQPWEPDELERVLDALALLVATLTPSPLELALASQASMTHWEQVAATPEFVDRLPAVDPWAAEHLDLLLRLASRWPDAAAGETLVHGDIRADNVLLTPQRVLFVDWPHAAVGAPYIDLLAMLPSAAMHGTEPQPIVERHPTTKDVDPEAIDVVLATFAGLFVERSLQPPDPLLPTIREFQRAQGRATLRWLADRLRSGT